MDPYYNTIMPKRYNPNRWHGDDFQINAKLDQLYERVNALDPKLVIDVGCGRNKHKGHIKNLIGFDASPFPEADLHCPILEAEFEPESADAILVLGSVQFISREYIIENIDRAISWVRPGGLIEMRVMVFDDQAEEFMSKYDKRSVKVAWDDELKAEVAKKHNLSYVVEPWFYQAMATDESIQRNAGRLHRAMAKRELKRENWTWIKN